MISGNVLRDDAYLPKLGLYIEQKTDSIYFKENKLNVYLSRHYSSNCEKLRNSQILDLHKCTNKYDERSRMPLVEAIIAQCQQLWQHEIEKLAEISKPDTDRSKRFAGVIEGITLFAGLVSSLSSTFSSLYHIFHHSQNNRKIDDLYIKGKQSSLIAANLAHNMQLDFTDLQSILCDNNALESHEILQLRANYFLQQSIKAIELELISFSFAQIPKSLNFLKNLVEICLTVRSNNMQFCKHIVYTQKIKVRFDGLTFNEDGLVSLVFLEIPIMSDELLVNTLFEINNIGYFQHDIYFKIDVPKFSIKTKNGFYYELNMLYCDDDLCHVNSVKMTTRSRCVQSVLNNKTDFCLSIIDEPPICNYIRVDTGHLIATKNAIFFPIDERTLNAISLINRTTLIQNPGRLLCSEGSSNSSHILAQPHTELRINNSMELTENLKIIYNITSKNIESRLSDNLKLIDQMRNLYDLDDTINLQGKNYSVVSMLLVSGTLLPTLIFLILIVYRYRVVLTKFYQNTLYKLWSTKRAQVEKVIELTDQRDENEIKNEIDTIIVNHAEGTIYPKL